jgi:hypothetical protein
MSCDNCDRRNVIKSLCFFSNRKEQFKLVTGYQFSFETFAKYAVEMNLVWKFTVACEHMTRGQAFTYWKQIKPFLTKAFDERK